MSKEELSQFSRLLTALVKCRDDYRARVEELAAKRDAEAAQVQEAANVLGPDQVIVESEIPGHLRTLSERHQIYYATLLSQLDHSYDYVGELRDHQAALLNLLNETNTKYAGHKLPRLDGMDKQRRLIIDHIEKLLEFCHVPYATVIADREQFMHDNERAIEHLKEEDAFNIGLIEHDIARKTGHLKADITAQNAHVDQVELELLTRIARKHRDHENILKGVDEEYFDSLVELKTSLDALQKREKGA